MKKLDEKVVYNITNLSMEKLQILLDYLNTLESPYEYLNAEEQRSKYPGNIYLISDNYNKWYFAGVKRYNWPDVDALTLFEEDALKIGDTFEKDGFVCKVLHQIDEKRWFRLKSPNNKDISYEKLDSEGLKDINHLYTKQEITDQEFIKQLEIHSK